MWYLLYSDELAGEGTTKLDACKNALMRNIVSYDYSANDLLVKANAGLDYLRFTDELFLEEDDFSGEQVAGLQPIRKTDYEKMSRSELINALKLASSRCQILSDKNDIRNDTITKLRDEIGKIKTQDRRKKMNLSFNFDDASVYDRVSHIVYGHIIMNCTAMLQEKVPDDVFKRLCDMQNVCVNDVRMMTLNDECIIDGNIIHEWVGIYAITQTLYDAIEYMHDSSKLSEFIIPDDSFSGWSSDRLYRIVYFLRPHQAHNTLEFLREIMLNKNVICSFLNYSIDYDAKDSTALLDHLLNSDRGRQVVHECRSDYSIITNLVLGHADSYETKLERARCM